MDPSDNKCTCTSTGYTITETSYVILLIQQKILKKRTIYCTFSQAWSRQSWTVILSLLKRNVKLWYTMKLVNKPSKANLNYQLTLQTYWGLLIRSRLMKSLASGETWENASSANSQSQRATFCRVSRSSSPAKGESPLNLYNKTLKLQSLFNK